jgi:hypothetical protein
MTQDDVIDWIRNNTATHIEYFSDEELLDEVDRRYIGRDDIYEAAKELHKIVIGVNRSKTVEQWIQEYINNTIGKIVR